MIYILRVTLYHICKLGTHYSIREIYYVNIAIVCHLVITFVPFSLYIMFKYNINMITVSTILINTAEYSI